MSDSTVKRQKAAGEKGKFGELANDVPSDLTLPPQGTNDPEFMYDDSYLLVHEFDANLLAYAEAQIEKANRRAEKAGVDARFTFETEHFDVKRVENGFTRVDERVRLTLNRPSIGHEDWQFIGKVSWDEEAGAIVHTADGAKLTERPERAKCDVCGQVRRRNDTYIIERDGEQMQVGGDCVKQFFGIRPAGLWMLDFDIDEPTGDGTGTSAKVSRTLSNETMAVAVSTIRAAGWTSRANSGMKPATADLVSEVMYGRRPMTNPKDERARKELMKRIVGGLDESAGEAAKVVDFVNDPANDDGSEYFANLKSVVATETVSRKNLGIFVSAVSAYHRAEAKREAAAVMADSKHVGVPGDKVAGHPVKVTGTRRLTNAYGVTTLIEMVDGDGNVLKWFASGEKNVNPGDSVTLSATIKGHDVYDGVNQTIVTRAKLTDPNS